MRKIIVFGAGGRTGALFVKQALDNGYAVTAFVRTPAKLKLDHPSLRIVTGDALDGEAVSQAIAGHDAVVSCLGTSGLGKSTALADMTGNIVQAMKRHGVQRILYVASAGVNKEVPGLIGSFIVWVLRHVLADHRNAIQRIAEAGLSYTIARPLQLTDGSLTGVYRMDLAGVPKGGSKISRADVAHFLLDRLSHDVKGKNDAESVGLAY